MEIIYLPPEESSEQNALALYFPSVSFGIFVVASSEKVETKWMYCSVPT